MSTSSVNPKSFPIVNSSVLVSIAAMPCLLAIVALAATQQLLEQVGLASEEIFRGDRLPVLHFPADGRDRTTNAQD